MQSSLLRLHSIFSKAFPNFRVSCGYTIEIVLSLSTKMMKSKYASNASDNAYTVALQVKDKLIGLIFKETNVFLEVNAGKDTHRETPARAMA
jgi:hypothetical protein